MKKRSTGNLELKEIIFNHVSNNIKSYFILLILFVIGIILGIISINNAKQEQQYEITTYITNFITSLNDNNVIEKSSLLKKSIKINLFTLFCLWVSSATVIGIPIVYGIIGYRGFCIGYSISSLIATLGKKNGIILSFSSMFLQNILIIPSIFIIAVSGIKLYKSIMKDKRKEKIKIEIYRHTITSVVIGVILIFSSLVEVYLSSNIVFFIIKYI